MTSPIATGLPGGHSEWEPPDPFSNSEVKTLCADASVDFVDVKVGHCQALNLMTAKNLTGFSPVRFFFALSKTPRMRRTAVARSPKHSLAFEDLFDLVLLDGGGP